MIPARIRKGSWLVARHGKALVYCALAWYRQLPFAVPGAVRLFANLTSLPASSLKTSSQLDAPPTNNRAAPGFLVRLSLPGRAPEDTSRTPPRSLMGLVPGERVGQNRR